MIERLNYYIDLLISLCGFDGSVQTGLFGWLVVILAALLVIASFYIALSRMIWPGESDVTHIKYSIFEPNEVEGKIHAD